MLLKRRTLLAQFAGMILSAPPSLLLARNGGGPGGHNNGVGNGNGGNNNGVGNDDGDHDNGIGNDDGGNDNGIGNDDGASDNGVMPGCVLISRMHSPSVPGRLSSQRKSQRVRPSQPSAWCAASAQRRVSS